MANNYYRFTVKRLKLIKKMVDFSSPEDVIKYSKILKEKQPDFCGIIDEVKIDTRCLEAHRFCTLFCSLALEQAEMTWNEKFPGLSKDTFHDKAYKLAQKSPSLGPRGWKFPRRLKRYVLKNEFDNEDSEWLGLMISAFLITFEEYIYLSEIGFDDPESVMSRR
jgi:hypothetical protein